MTKFKGFTLIELLIVIVLIVLMLVIAIPGFAKYGSKSELSDKAEEIKTIIEEGQLYSKSPQDNSNGAELNILKGNGDVILLSKGRFADPNQPKNIASTEDGQSSINLPGYMDLIIDSPVSADKASLYFVSPGIYMKDNPNSGVIIKIKSSKYSKNEFVKLTVLPAKTGVVAKENLNQNFSVDLSWGSD